jgi:hypothetical protein
MTTTTFVLQAIDMGDNPGARPMRTQLRVKSHLVVPGESVVELWHNGQLIGTVVGAEGPGVRIISWFLRNSGDAIRISTPTSSGSIEEPPALEVALEP